MTEYGPAIALGSLGLALIASIIGAFRYFNGELTEVRRTVSDGRRADTDAARVREDVLRKRIDEVGESVHRLEVEVARNSSLSGMENRLTSLLKEVKA